MPKIGQVVTPQKPVVPYPEGRWRCPVCGTIYWYDRKGGCCHKQCSFRGRLERTR